MAMGLLPTLPRKPAWKTSAPEWVCAGSTTTMTAPRSSTSPTCGRRRAPAFRPRIVFQKDAPEKVRALYRKHARGNSLFRSSGDGFQDASASAGVEMGRWAWSCDAWDFDHDGFPDLYIANGMVSGPVRDDLNSFFWRQVVANSPVEAKPSHDYEQGWNALNELIRSDGTWSGYERNVFYANNRDGTFSDVSGAVGLDFMEDGRAFALADFDHDGRLEVFLKNRNGPQLRILAERDEGPRRRRSHSVCAAARAIVTRSARRSRWKRDRGGRRACCRPGRDSFPSTARKCSSGWEMPRAQCRRRSAGPVDWCRNFATFRSTTGCGWRRVRRHRDWRHSKRTLRG